MFYIAFNTDTGFITQKGVCPDETPPGLDTAYIEITAEEFNDLKSTAHAYVKDGVLTPYTEEEKERVNNQPFPESVWDEPTKTWIDIRTLEPAKAEKRRVINTAWTKANQTSFTYAGKRIACDPDSVVDIQTLTTEIAVTGVLPANFSGAWKALDNTTVAIPNKAGWFALYVALSKQRRANFARAQELKASVAAATTLAEIDAISVLFD